MFPIRGARQSRANSSVCVFVCPLCSASANTRADFRDSRAVARAGHSNGRLMISGDAASESEAARVGGNNSIEKINCSTIRQAISEWTLGALARVYVTEQIGSGSFIWQTTTTTSKTTALRN